MFDNLDDKTTQTAPVPGNVPVPDGPQTAEDIFSETNDSAPTSPSNLTDQPKVQSEQWSQVDPGIDSLDIEKQGKKKMIMLMLMFIGMILIGWGTYLAFGKIVSSIGSFGKSTVEKTETDKAASNLNQTDEANTTNDTISTKEPDTVSGTSTEDYIPAPAEVENADADKDGLLDTEENVLGTNPGKVDSDDDGLFDREEVRIYKTDPLKSDTDSDGFMDGEEVKSGYNPKGDGKLYRINAQTAQ